MSLGSCGVEDLGQVQFFAEAGLPARFSPAAYNVFADAVKLGVFGDHGEHPVRKEVYVCIAVGGEHSCTAVFAEEAMADGKAFLLFADVF